MEDIIIRDGIDKMDFGKAFNSASVVGAFLLDQTQIGYSRVISDKTRFAYILDVYVDNEYRKRVGRKTIKHILNHKELKDVYIWLLGTKNAHGLYSKAGFKPLSNPSNWMEIRYERPKR
jgi:ribosomal protein S18 acetylase RimI-like enzyme